MSGKAAKLRPEEKHKDTPLKELFLQDVTYEEDANAHGYGLENITQAAGRYYGAAVYDVNGDQFTLTVMLPLPVTS